MKRLYMTVEGQTEQAFATKVLTPHLTQFGVHLHKPGLTGMSARRDGRIPKGGMGTTFDHSLRSIKNWLKQDRSSDARFSMMVDLYSLPTDFPGYAEGMRRATGREKATALQRSMEEQIGDSRFIAYLQCHEFESLVLVDPARLAEIYSDRRSEIDELGRECAQFATPEGINLRRHSHPKARILQCVPNYQAKVDGPKIAAEIGLPTLRERCPHFGEWLTRLENLNQPAT